MSLDQRFFEHTASTVHKGVTLESYKAVYARSTMVLFSKKTRTPLAALTLKAADDIGVLSVLTGRPAPPGASEPYFQGMLNMPNQTFTFCISNLSSDGMINFNILHTPHRVSRVDPGPAHGVNEVNELHPNQSYVIEADQRNNRKMMLAGQTKTIVDPTTAKEREVAVTVKDTETKEKSTGLYFYLSVVPDKNCKKLVECFKEGTVWKVLPGFVRQIKIPASLQSPFHSAAPRYDMDNRSGFPAPPPPRNSPFHSSAPRYDTDNRIGWQRRGPLGYSFAASPGPPRNYGGGDRRGHDNAAFDTFSGPHVNRGPPWLTSSRAPPLALFAAPPQPPGSGAAQMTSSASASTVFRANLSRSGPPIVGSARAAAPPPIVTLQQGQQSRFEVVQSPGGSAHAREEEHTTYNNKNRLAETVDVGTTQAAQLNYGQQVQVVSSYTGHEYAYDLCSDPTVLCMSIWEDMKFLPLPNIEKELEEEVEEWVKNSGKALLESLTAVYKTDTCVIDLESTADTIICTCGHQCINHENVSRSLRKCPVCRCAITAFVRADGMLLE